MTEMDQEYGNINPAKVLMHEAFNEVLRLMRSEPTDQLPYLLGRFDAYLMMSETLGILNSDEVKVLNARRDAIPAERTATGLD
jgi:hypothetical protein